jgi:hypothetical protein
MHHLHVSMMFSSPVEAVFDQIADHASFLSVGGLSCRLIKDGSPTPNGLGAVREVKAGKMIFKEEILGFDRPRRYDYKIVSAESGGKPSPLDHERGWLTFEQVGSQTRVDWHTRYRIRVPIIGWFVERFVIGRSMKPKFLEMLEIAKQKVESAGGAPSRRS